jgi:hypothetical protein
VVWERDTDPGVPLWCSAKADYKFLKSLGLKAGTTMRVLALAMTAAVAVCAGSVADAAPRVKRVRTVDVVDTRPLPHGTTTIITRDEYGRTRTRILVQKRSFLDPGTNSLPGDNVDSFRSTFMNYRPGSAATERTAFDRPGWWNDQFFFPSQRNPYPWLPN